MTIFNADNLNGDSTDGDSNGQNELPDREQKLTGENSNAQSAVPKNEAALPEPELPELVQQRLEELHDFVGQFDLDKLFLGEPDHWEDEMREPSEEEIQEQIQEQIAQCEIPKEDCIALFKELFRLKSWSMRLDASFERNDLAVPSCGSLICSPAALSSVLRDCKEVGCADSICHVWELILNAGLALQYPNAAQSLGALNRVLREIKTTAKYPALYVKAKDYRLAQLSVSAINRLLEAIERHFKQQMKKKRSANRTIARAAERSTSAADASTDRMPIAHAESNNEFKIADQASLFGFITDNGTSVD